MQAVVTLERWWSRAMWLAWLTIAYNIVEGVVAMGFGVADESIALFGFGVDSWIEVTSAVVVLWRLQGESGRAGPLSLERERQATQGIGALMLLLGAGMAVGGVATLALGGRPETTWSGVAVSVASLLLMASLWRAKVRTADAVGSATIRADAACSRACMQLSVVLLAGSALFAIAPVLWWADAVAAVALGFLVGREGWGSWTAARAPEFDGGGCCSGCHHEE